MSNYYKHLVNMSDFICIQHNMYIVGTISTNAMLVCFTQLFFHMANILVKLTSQHSAQKLACYEQLQQQ